LAEDCKHPRRRLIAKDEVLEFEECLDCGEILEKPSAPDPPTSNESLSDA
jgi:hypothetical protein